MEYFGFGEYEFGSNQIIEAMKRGISGTHRPNGMVMIWGKGVRAGTRLKDAEIVDLAPTLLQLMGEPAPQDMDGRVLTQALLPEYGEAPRAEGLASTEALPPLPPTADAFLSDEDESLIKERLRGLGYVG
jgi:hypothetical protein